MKLPYGYVLDGKEIAIHEERANNVRSIFECYLAGASLGKIVDMCIYRIKLASCTENFRQVAGENLPPRRKGPPVMGSASRSGWQSVGSVIVVGNRDAILGQNSLQQLSAFQVKV